MERIKCQKCGQEVSNDFGVTLSFCTNCGAALSNLISDKTPESAKAAAAGKKPKNYLFAGLIAGAVLTLFLLGGFYLLYKYSLSRNETSSEGKSNPASTPRIKPPGFDPADAAEISEVIFSSWKHKGSLSSGDGYVESNRITFERDGGATQIISINYDSSERTDNSTTYKARMTNEQFQRLAQAVVENDFFSQIDSTEIISEGENVLTVKYRGEEKEIKTSNVERDTPEIKAILNEIIYVQSELSWNAEN